MSPPETLSLRGQYDASTTITHADNPFHVQPSFPNQLIFVDTTDGDVTVILPEKPPVGTIVTVIDLAGAIDTGHQITLTGNFLAPDSARQPNGIDGQVERDYVPDPSTMRTPQYVALTMMFVGRSPEQVGSDPIPLGYRVIWGFAGFGNPLT